MMRLIVGSSLKFRFLVAAAAAALIGFGTTLVGDAQVDVFPEFAPPKGRDPDDRPRPVCR